MQNVKQKIAWLWQNTEKILIIVFFLTFSLNIRKIFLTPYSFLKGRLNEYTTISFGWADLLILVTIVIYTIINIYRQVINSYYASPGHKKIFEKSFKNVSRETFYLLIFLSWVGLSIFWSQYRPIAIYRFLTLIEILLFAAVVIKSLKNSRWLNIALFALVLNGLFQSFLGIAQFIHNSSLGFHFLGESIIGPNIDGVAKIMISSEKHIRAYGTFPHPNILAGFLIIPLFIIVAELISRRLLPPYKGETERGSDFGHQDLAPAPPLLRRGSSSKVSHETILDFIPTNFLWLLFSIIGVGFVLTFSRSAFLGLFFGLLIYIFSKALTKNLIQIFKKYYFISIPLVFALIIATIALISMTSFFSNQSLEERQLYQHVSYETISSNPAQGIGAGQFILNEHRLHPDLETWQYQPVHNLYLLLFSELGIFGFIFFLLFVFSIFLRLHEDKQHGEYFILTYYSYYCIIISFLVVSLFDHYFWDIKQGMLIFALPLIILSSSIRGKRKLDKELQSVIIKKY